MCAAKVKRRDLAVRIGGVRETDGVSHVCACACVCMCVRACVRAPFRSLFPCAGRSCLEQGSQNRRWSSRVLVLHNMSQPLLLLLLLLFTAALPACRLWWVASVFFSMPRSLAWAV